VSVTRATANAATASIGDKLIFRGVVKDLGPDPVTDSLDIHFQDERHITTGRISCREPGVGEVVSPDGNYCEFGPASVGERFVQRVAATVTSDRGNARLTFCASTESNPPTDPDLTNNCLTVRVPTSG
jgi:hypothetical protein